MVRDHTLIAGLVIPLVVFVVLTIAGRARIGPFSIRWPRRPSTSRELVPLEPTKD